MLLVSGMCMSNVQSDLLCCCHSSQNTVAKHEVSDLLPMSNSATQNAALLPLLTLYRMSSYDLRAASIFRDNEYTTAWHVRSMQCLLSMS